MDKSIPIILGVLLLAVILPSQASAFTTTNDFISCTFSPQATNSIFSGDLTLTGSNMTFNLLSTASISEISHDGCQALAQDPTDGTWYMVQRIQGGGGSDTHYLVTVDPTTGLGTNIGTLPDGMQSMAFNSDGDLFTYTNSQASPSSTIHQIDKTNASSLNTCNISPSNTNESGLAYDYTNEIMYVVLGSTNEIAEIDPISCSQTNTLSLTGSATFWFSWAWNTDDEVFYLYEDFDGVEIHTLNPTTGVVSSYADVTGLIPEPQANNRQKGFAFSLNLVSDTTDPVISSDQEPITIFEGIFFDEFKHVTCIDDVDGDITNTMMVSGTVDTSKRGVQTVDYFCTDTALNSSMQTISYIVKIRSSGGSSSSTSDVGGTTSSTPSLSSIPTLSFQDSPSQPTTEGRSIADLFASLFDNRISEGITTPAQSVSSPLGASGDTTQRPNPITVFLQNLFASFFN